MSAGHLLPGPLWAAEAGPEDAPVLACVHGSLDRSAGMLKVSRHLEDRWRVLRYDRRGYGRSLPHDGPFGIAEQVEDLLRLLADRPAVVFGHSFGGNVALAAAAARPGQIRAVAVYETPLSWYPWWPGTTAGANAVATRGTPAEAAEAFMRRLIGDVRWDGLPEATREARRAEGPAMVGELSDLRARPAWDPSALQLPVLALYGETGAPHHRQGMEFLAGELPDCRVGRLDGAGHGAPLSHAAELAARVEAFFSETARAREQDQREGGGAGREQQ